MTIEMGKFFNNIKKDSRICIYGSNKIAEKIYKILSESRKDIRIKFFADSQNSGELFGLPIYKGNEIPLHKDEIDGAIIASYSARFFLELLLLLHLLDF